MQFYTAAGHAASLCKNSLMICGPTACDGPQILEHAAPRSEERGACLAAEINFTYTRLTGAYMPPVPRSYDDAETMLISIGLLWMAVGEYVGINF